MCIKAENVTDSLIEMIEKLDYLELCALSTAIDHRRLELRETARAKFKSLETLISKDDKDTQC